MSKQEILSWTSIGFTFSLLFFYVIFLFGWPDFLPDFSTKFTTIFFNVFWISILVEFIIELTYRKSKVDKDERDEKIEAKGYKWAYLFLTITTAVIIFQILLSNFLGEAGSNYHLLGQPNMIFHALLIVLFTSAIVKRGTMLYYYQKF